jgi:hypothetical protein
LFNLIRYLLDQESPKGSRLGLVVFNGLVSIQNMREASSQHSFQCAPPHLSHFQPPNRVHYATVELEHQFSVFRMPPVISGSRYSLLCFAASGQETSSCIGLRMLHCHRSIRPLHSFSLGPRIKPALFSRSILRLTNSEDIQMYVD